MSGPKIAALYGLIPNQLGYCGPQQDLLRRFISGKLPMHQIIPTLEKFEAAYGYYQLIAQKNKIADPFNKKVVEAYWLGNKLLEKVSADDLREMIIKKFAGPKLLSKAQAKKRAALIPEDSKPHHSFHVMVLGSITGSVNFAGSTNLKDNCRVGWGRVILLKRDKIVVSYEPLKGRKKLVLGRSKKKVVNWDKEILPEIKIGNWISFHWNYAIQKLNENDIVNLHKYTQNTLKSLYARQ